MAPTLSEVPALPQDPDCWESCRGEQGRNEWLCWEEAGNGKRTRLRQLSFSLCLSMTESPTATSPATATCLAPKVGSPIPDTGPNYGMYMVCGDVWTTSPVVKHTLPPTPVPSSPEPCTTGPRPLVIGLSLSGVNIGDVGCYIYDPVKIKFQ